MNDLSCFAFKADQKTNLHSFYNSYNKSADMNHLVDQDNIGLVPVYHIYTSIIL